MSFGQIVLGPPGAGKTVYCQGMGDFLRSIGRYRLSSILRLFEALSIIWLIECRKVAVINLDPANDHLPYIPMVDIGELITLEDACEEFGLGPNGGTLTIL